MKLIIFTIFSLIIASSLCFYDNSQTIHKILDQFIDGNVKDLFKVWHLVHSKTYTLDSEEAKKRFSIFKANLAYIKQSNSKNLPYKLGINEFSDLTNEEFMEKYTNTLLPEDLWKNFLVEEEDDDLTKRFLSQGNVEINWSKYFSPPRYQGACGSCWAFGAGSVIEGVLGIKYNIAMPYLSIQQIIDCNPRKWGCGGGSDTIVMKEYLTKTGLMYEKDYPYKAKQGECKFDSNAKSEKVLGVKICEGGSAKCSREAYLALLSQGPVSAAVDASGDFPKYKNGIYTKECTASNINHVIVVAGYGYDATTNLNYFLIRNSWGSGWGERGYMRLAENPANKNSCFVANRGYLPIV